MSSKGGPAIDLNEIVDVGTQYLTLGILGYDAKEGKVKKGFITHGLDETIGEITGRNLARREANNNERRLNLEQQQLQQEQSDKQVQKYRNDVYASQQAEIARSRPSGDQPGILNAKLGQDEKDFLGL